ncbi:Small-subunit processome [Penicillium brevicompactum]|uniref:Small-subunit processome Utp11 n=1 Tax=Penicillium brevicompactum TaxID=5074 RepID=UPI0025418C82|nr:Small-subunit processome Utp11 [Penicillium brevicompactum]KAJ5332917.1 Small-subunit processome Utp11 [Penicillium brevicompactum]
MSSMRNAVQRRNHKERGQVQGREKWGLLEKHKDYSLRAKDYNAKKAKLKRLEEKAKDRNPDEFAFGMMGDKNRTQGKHGRGAGTARASAADLSHDALKLLKTQDKGYLRTVGERLRREIERLERDVELQNGLKKSLGEKGGAAKDQSDDEDGSDDDFDDFDFGAPVQPKPNRTVFADDRKDQLAMKKQRLQKDDASDDEDQETPKARKTPKQLEAERKALVEARRARKTRKRAVEARANKLAALRKQHKEVQAAEKELDWQRAKMGNSVGGTNKDGIKWKIRERKR